MRAAAVLLTAGVALVCATPAQAATKTVRIYDNYFLKDDLTVKRGTVVKWRWPGVYEAGDVHDVKLKSALRARRSSTPRRRPPTSRSSASSRSRASYRIVCTLHEEMTMKIRVKR